MKEFLTKKEVSNLLGLSVRMVDVLRTCNRLPALKLGGLIRFSSTDVSDFVKQCKVGDTVENVEATFPLVSSEAVENLLSCKETALFKLRHGGGIPHYRFGATVRYDMGEVEQWARRQVEGGC